MVTGRVQEGSGPRPSRQKKSARMRGSEEDRRSCCGAIEFNKKRDVVGWIEQWHQLS